MEKLERYKIVFETAKTFLDEIVSSNHHLNDSILKQHFQSESKFDDIQDAMRRLVQSLSNRNMMSSVINYKKRIKEMDKILFNYDSHKILSKYKGSQELLNVFKKEFNLLNTGGKRSLWNVFSDGIISGANFVDSFKDKNDFDHFVKNFSLNKYTKAALPMLLSKEINGFGFALACDFLKELGYREYPKPDVHLITIFHELGLSGTTDPYVIYKNIIEMAEIVGEDAYTVDKIFWLISSGRFYLVNIKTGNNRDKFIQRAKSALSSASKLNETFETLWEYSTSNDRVCPQPQKWAELFRILKHTKQNPDGGWSPSLPLILAAWGHATPTKKQLRFEEHIRWAFNNDQIEEIGKYLRSLHENDWAHFGEI
jgi:hypothetical protein